MRAPRRIAVFLCALAAPAFAQDKTEDAPKTEDTLSLLAKQPSLTDTQGGPKEQLRRFGVSTDLWVTQFSQGVTSGIPGDPWRYGGKMDAFLRVDGGKIGLWKGLMLNVQYEHYFGRNINRLDAALVPVNAAQAFIERDGYHSALSVLVTQAFSEHFSITAGKFNMMTLAAQTPLIGGGGIDTFMNRALALPGTGIGVASPESVADRLIISPPYLLGAAANYKTDAFNVMLMAADPRNAQNPRVLERPFERGVGIGGGVTINTELFGLRGYHTLRGAYITARGFDLDDIDLPLRLAPLVGITKKGYWFGSYAVQQYLMQSAERPEIGWGFFGLASLSDGNPNPVRWSVLAGLAGNNLMQGREADRWGVGFFHYGLADPLLSGLAARGIFRRSEGGVEVFYNWAIANWLRLTGDVQLVDPWNPSRARASYAGLRLQTKF